MFLLDDILLAPLNGLVWIGRKICDFADQELFDEELVKEKLLELQFQREYDLEPMSEDEFRARETALLERLEAIRKAKEEV